MRMEPFREATYEQLERVLNIIDRTKPRENSRTNIPSIGFLERWVDDKLTADDGGQMPLESTLRMWENAEIEED
jgi:hypothetical protein